MGARPRTETLPGSPLDGRRVVRPRLHSSRSLTALLATPSGQTADQTVVQADLSRDRPNLRTTFPKRPAPTTTERPTTPQRQQTTNSRFSTAGRPASPLATTEAPSAGSAADGGLPAPVKAAPGPNGEEYYYYYYYYDDEEGEKNGLDSAPGS